MITANLRLYDLGHDFRVKGLPEYASDAIGVSLSGVLKKICDPRLSEDRQGHACTELQDYLRASDFVPTFLRALQAADSIRQKGADENERVRPWEMLIDFFVAGMEVLLYEPGVEEFIEADSVPSFAKSYLLTKRSPGRCKSKWMRDLVPEPPKDTNRKEGKCSDCNKDLQGGDVGMVNPKSWRVWYSEVCCVECGRSGTNGRVHAWMREVFDDKED